MTTCRTTTGRLFVLALALLTGASACLHGAAARDAVEHTPSGEPKPLVLVASPIKRGRSGNWAEVLVTVRAQNASLNTVTITGSGPDRLTFKPAEQTVKLQRQKETSARFRLYNPDADWEGLEPLSFIAKADTDGFTRAVQITVDWPENAGEQGIFHRPTRTWVLFVMAAIGLPLLFPGVRNALRRGSLWIYDTRFLLDLFVLIVVEVFVISNLNPEFLLTSTTTTGGDTASHYYTLQYLRDVLLPAGRVSGWTPGNYAGFPILQFYFPLDFLLMSLLSGIISLQVAFKLGSIAGTLLLPVAAYGMLRLMRCPFPGPGIAAVLTLPFLFNASHSMWGGNILSSFAGEFSYSLSMALSLLLLGSLYRGIRDNRRVITNAILVFLVGFSHGYTLLFVEAMSLFLLITPRGFIQRLVYMGKVYILAFCLLAFWLVPLLVFTKYTTSYDLVWTINAIEEVMPRILAPALFTGVLGSLVMLVWSFWDRKDTGKRAAPMLGYLWFGLAMSVVFFIAAPRLGVVDIRYVPYGHLMGCLLAAVTLGWLGWLLRRWKVDWVLPPIVFIAVVVWTGGQLGPVSGWAKWNYEGFEAKDSWPIFKKINDELRGDFNDPRVVFEHSSEHNTFGTTRAFESLPLFSGRATLEGLYMQASISAPFVFYIQSEVSQQKSVPFPQYSYSSMDFDRARPHLELFNVRDLIIRSDLAKKAIRKAAGYRLKDTIGQYELWELTTNRNRYVEALHYEPVLYPASSWKQESYRWFSEESLLPVHLVFVPEGTHLAPPFRVQANDLRDLPRVPVGTDDCDVRERIGNHEIAIETDCIGRPLLVKMSYHPNWHVDGADRIYLTSPSFMMVYPKQRIVRLWYGPGIWDRIGQTLTLTALVILFLNIPLLRGQSRTIWQAVAEHHHIPPSLTPDISFDPSSKLRWTVLITTLVVAGSGIAWTSYLVYHSDPNRIYNQSIKLKDQKRFQEAREGFRFAMEKLTTSDLAQNSAYYIAITYYLEKQDQQAIAAFEELINRYPKSNWVPESRYHIALCLFRLGQDGQGVDTLRRLREQYPGTRWAEYAKDRLREHNALTEEWGPLSGDNVADYMSIAIDHFNHDRLDEARILFEEISTRFPDYSGTPQALAALALVYYKRGDCTATMTRYKTLIERYPNDKLVPEAYYHLGVCSERLGDAVAGREYFSHVAERYPDSVYGRQALSRLSR